MTQTQDATPETPEEIIERLLKSNNRLAQMVKRGGDRLAESARELMAQGWDAGVKAVSTAPYVPERNCHVLPTNPYRQPINHPGATE